MCLFPLDYTSLVQNLLLKLWRRVSPLEAAIEAWVLLRLGSLLQEQDHVQLWQCHLKICRAMFSLLIHQAQEMTTTWNNFVLQMELSRSTNTNMWRKLDYTPYNPLGSATVPTDLLCISPLDLLEDTVLLASPLAKPMATSSKYSIVRASGAFTPGPVNKKGTCEDMQQKLSLIAEDAEEQGWD